jgi:two-component system cell cycle response regulator
MVLPLIRDPRSGAYSRAFFDEIIERELERARRHNVILSVLAVVLADWNSLAREENAGTVDGLARTLANTLLANFRMTDFLFRWEDDEFLALLVEADHEACKLKVAQLGEVFQPWREGKGPVARALKVRAGAATLTGDREFAGVLQLARAAARDASGEFPAVRV